MTPEGWRWLAFRHLWVWAPHLHSTGRRQARKLRDALGGWTRSFPGFPPLGGIWYPRGYRKAWDPSMGCDPGIPYSPHTRNGREPLEVLDRHTAWAVGWHAGRVMALRLEAYDRKRWPVQV